KLLGPELGGATMGTLVCKCGKELNYEARHVGKKVRCAGCAKVLVVPEEEVPELEEVEAIDEVEEVKPSRKRPRLDEEDEDRPRKAKRSSRDEDEDDRPRRRRRDEDENEEEDEDERPRKRRKKASAEPNGFAVLLGSMPGRWTLIVAG